MPEHETTKQISLADAYELVGDGLKLYVGDTFHSDGVNYQIVEEDKKEES